MAQKRKKKNNESAYIIIMGLLLTAAAVIMLALIFVLAGDKGSTPSSPDASSEAESLPGESSEEISEVESSQTESSEAESEVSEEESLPEESQVEVDYETRVGKKYQIDIGPYLQYIQPENADDYSYLVNLSHPISVEYVPEDLVTSIYTRKDGRADQKLVETAAKALEAMMAEAELNGVTNVTITSAYRSAAYQKQLFDMYTQNEMDANPSLTREQAEAIVLTYSMRPGCSEHQTGLCCDMHNLGAASQTFGSKPEAIWLADNCYRFGFVLRYAKDKEDITGVEWEPWHFRFVGREAATRMHELGMCLEEYTEYIANGGR